jgi:hypothetical protein
MTDDVAPGKIADQQMPDNILNVALAWPASRCFAVEEGNLCNRIRQVDQVCFEFQVLL